jgi:hypothetical protein
MDVVIGAAEVSATGGHQALQDGEALTVARVSECGAYFPTANSLPHLRMRRDVDRDTGERRRQEQALDEALKNTFPASDPVSVEQPTTSGRACRS